MRKTFIKVMWTILLSIFGVGVLLFVLIWHGVIGYSPDIDNLQDPISKSASLVYSADGKLIGTYKIDRANRIPVTFAQMSPHLVHALVATEDERFYEHSGIDFKALGRAIVKRGFMGQESAGGGSTITQQLAKQLYSDPAKSTVQRMFQKPIEWVTAIKLERNYTKEEIIALYLNYFDFLHGAVGIKMAANTYYQKEPQNLTVGEAATLVGLCKNPSYYNPVRYRERCKERRNTVLAQMVRMGYLSKAECDKYSAEDIVLNFHRPDHKEGEAVYFREFLRQYMMMERPERENYPSWNNRQFVIDSIAFATDPLCGWCNKNTKRNGQHYNVYTDGLRIYTTVDTRMQKYAEEAVYEHVGKFLQPKFTAQNKTKPNAPFSNHITKEQAKQIMDKAVKQSARYKEMKDNGASEAEIEKAFHTPVEMSVFTYRGDKDTTMTPYDSIRYYKSYLRSGFMSMEVRTGHVKAYVGGIDFEHFQYDMVMGGRRQIGSTMKPYLYSLAMENGASPCDLAPNVMKTYIVDGGRWTPRNGSRARYGAMVTLKWGLAQSNNWISAYLMSQLNPNQLVSLLHKYGISNPDIQPSMALCLGPCEVTVGEMVSGYTAFANNGIRVAPLFVTKITDDEGNVIAQFQPQMNEVISSTSAYKMLELLQGVVNQGTGRRLRGICTQLGEAGGKTGTTNRNADAWFMGFTPELVNGAWVGGEERDIHFDHTSIGQGAVMALPIWGYYMNKVFADKDLPYDPNAKFDVPKDFNSCKEEDSMSDSEFNIEEVFE